MKPRRSPLLMFIVMFMLLLILISLPVIFQSIDREALRPMDVNRARVLVSTIAQEISNEFPAASQDEDSQTNSLGIENTGEPLPAHLAERIDQWSEENQVSAYMLSLSSQIIYQTPLAPKLPEMSDLMEFAQPDASFYRDFPGKTRLMVPAIKDGTQVGNILFIIPLEKVLAKEGIWPSVSTIWLFLTVFWGAALFILIAYAVLKHYEEPRRWMNHAIHAAERDLKLPGSIGENRMTPVIDGFLRLVDLWRDIFGKMVRSEQIRKEQLAVISHEIRTPVTSIAMYAEGLESGVADTPEMRASYIAILARKTKELNLLVNNLFDLARQEVDMLKVEPVEAYSKSVLNGIVQSLKEAFAKSGRNLCWPTEIPNLLVPLDKLRMEQVLSNLIHNALKHTEPGGTITLDAFLQDDHLVLTVSDDGHGIDPSDLPHIFDRFYQGRSRLPIGSVNKQQKGADPTGAGLGLSICRSIVEAHGGRLYVESALGRGTRITIVL